MAISFESLENRHLLASLSGSVFFDHDDDGVIDASDFGLPNIEVVLRDNTAGEIERRTRTDDNGSFLFTDIPAGIYDLSEVQPDELSDGIDVVGTHGGNVMQDLIRAIALDDQDVATGYKFGENGINPFVLRPTKRWLLASSPPFEDIIKAAVGNNREINSPPNAVNDNGLGFTTDEDTSFRTASVLDNDRDIDGDVIDVVMLDLAATRGLAALGEDGSIDYDPNGQFEHLGVNQAAVDKLTYVVADPEGNSDTAEVEIEIIGKNDAPVAADDNAPELTTDEDTAFEISGLLENDSDVDSDDNVSISKLNTSETRGTATVTANGRVVYNPNRAFETLAPGETEVDRFSYTLADENGAFDEAQVEIIVAGVNDPPDLVASIKETGAALGQLLEVLFSASDIDGEPDGSDLTYLLDSEDSGIDSVMSQPTISKRDNGVLFQWIPGEFGDFGFRVLVIDAHGAADQESFEVEVFPVDGTS